MTQELLGALVPGAEKNEDWLKARPNSSNAIVTGLSTGAKVAAEVSRDTGKVVENEPDTYQGLKALLTRKFGYGSEVVQAVDTVEENPESDWRQALLKERLEHARVDEDPEVRRASHELVEEIEALYGEG